MKTNRNYCLLTLFAIYPLTDRRVQQWMLVSMAHCVV